MSNRNGNGNPASVERLRLGAGFQATEREDVVSRLRKLDRRLKRFDADAVELELSVKDRDANEQQVVLEARVAGLDRFIATSREPAIKDAIADVRDEVWRQIDVAVQKRTVERRRP